MYRAIDEHGQVVDVLLWERRDTASAEAFFARALGHAGQGPTPVITDHHQPSRKAVQQVLPETEHIRTGLHRARGETTKPIERSHIFTRDRLRASRGLRTLTTGQRVLEGFAALQALRRGHAALRELLPGDPSVAARPHERARAVVRALHVLGPTRQKVAA
ncbi:MAG TPA: DDE-type integrase/transposase/recombinase [Chloroflexota bacterium]|nr:DDE-type integrase/transposase/recombinase [Chloroflexota bacterium]